MSEYTERVDKFLDDRGISYVCHYVGSTNKWGVFKEAYACSLYRPDVAEVLITEFYGPDEPSADDLLSCLQKYEPEAKLKDFMQEFGYSIAQFDEAEKAFKGVHEEWRKMAKFFTPTELEELREIAI